MKDNIFADITKNASKPFYTASLLFPKKVRNDVFILYSFVRIADDLIDQVPSNIREFNRYRKETEKVFAGKEVENVFIQTFVKLAKKKNISYELINDFFEAQVLDSTKKNYKNYDELLKFVYGVAEVIGLMMAHIMELPKQSYMSARTLGRAMQLVNILRDIEEDRLLGRTYIPQNELAFFGLPTVLTADVARKKPHAFHAFITFQTGRVFDLLEQAREGFSYIPSSYVLPIKISTDIYYQTAKRIKKNPMLIFQNKVRPNKIHIAQTVLKNYLSSFL